MTRTLLFIKLLSYVSVYVYVYACGVVSTRYFRSRDMWSRLAQTDRTISIITLHVSIPIYNKCKSSIIIWHITFPSDCMAMIIHVPGEWADRLRDAWRFISVNNVPLTVIHSHPKIMRVLRLNHVIPFKMYYSKSFHHSTPMYIYIYIYI